MNLKEQFRRIGGFRLVEADVFGAPAGGADTDADKEKDVEKLAKKFEGPLKPVIELINTKEELAQAVQLMLSKAEENKPGLGKKAKLLLVSMIKDLQETIMERFNSAKWIKAFKANAILEKDESIKLDD